MGYSETLQIRNTLSATDTNELSALNASAVMNLSKNLTDGDGDDEIDTGFTYEETLAPAGSKTFDLDDDTQMVDLSRNPIAFDKVKILVIQNSGANPLVLSGDFLGIGTETITLAAGAFLIIFYGPAGRAVVATTGDAITIASTLGTTYKILISGVKA